MDSSDFRQLAYSKAYIRSQKSEDERLDQSESDRQPTFVKHARWGQGQAPEQSQNALSRANDLGIGTSRRTILFRLLVPGVSPKAKREKAIILLLERREALKTLAAAVCRAHHPSSNSIGPIQFSDLPQGWQSLNLK